jgi:hypothetical protein
MLAVWITEFGACNWRVLLLIIALTIHSAGLTARRDSAAFGQLKNRLAAA